MSIEILKSRLGKEFEHFLIEHNLCPECLSELTVKDGEKVCKKCGLVCDYVPNLEDRIPYNQTRTPTNLLAYGKNLGGTMRLGAQPAILKKGTKIYDAYNVSEINERHRHRYEFTNKYRDVMEQNGLVLSALSPDNNLVEAVEYRDHPWGIGVQFHPEFKSKPINPHPLFVDFIKESLNKRKKSN